MPGLARILFGFSAAFLIAGVLVIVLARFHLPLGRLPGDLSWRGRGWAVFFPFATSLLLSVVLSLVFWVVSRLR